MYKEIGKHCSNFVSKFFYISKVVSLQKEVLTFRQLEEESLGKSWDRFNDLINFGPDLAIPDPMLLQHFYEGLSNDSRQSLDITSRGSFLCLSDIEARSKLDIISKVSPCLDIDNPLRENIMN